MFFRKKAEMPVAASALPGRNAPFEAPGTHFIFKRPMAPPYPAGFAQIIFGLGCFWGAERKFWEIEEGIHLTAVGYCAGFTPNPTYEEVCSGLTGHNEVVLVIYDPALLNFEFLLALFFESHDPTQGMRQGNDVGTQYRSGIYVTTPAQRSLAEATRVLYQERLNKKGYGAITTEIVDAGSFYFAESYHQQYLAKNPRGYCGLGGTGVSCPIGLSA